MNESGSTLSKTGPQVRNGKALWMKLRSIGLQKIIESGKEKQSAWLRLRSIGVRRIIELGKLNPLLWTRKTIVNKTSNEISINKTKKGIASGLANDFFEFILSRRLLFWNNGHRREIRYGLQTCKSKIRSIGTRAERYTEKLRTGEPDFKPLVIRWGRRSFTEPLMLSCYALLIPMAILQFRGRSFLSAILLISLSSAAIQHLSGEERRWMGTTRLCPLVSSFPVTVIALLYSSSYIVRLFLIVALLACVWLYKATGYPGTYPFEKYHLYWHWAWFVLQVAAVVGMPKS